MVTDPSLPDIVARAVKAWAAHNPQPLRLVVALSGGLDSQTLLHALLQSAPAVPVLALHIDHQLQMQDWGCQLEQQCAASGVEYRCLTVEVENQSGRGLEAAAREARYRAFEDFLQPGDLLLLAQHQRDQAETLMLRLLRGAGSKGLAAMPASRAIGKAHLLRPLLNESREQLERYVAAHNVPVLEDPSNQSEQFDRNFLRLKVLPLLRERWPALDNSFADVAALQAEADTLHMDLASIDAKACDLRDEPFGFSICERGFKRLSGARRNNMLRGLCAGNGLPLPPRKRLQTLMQQLDASADRQPAVEWPGAKALRWGGRLYLLGDLPESPSACWYSLEEAAEGALGAVLCRIPTGEAGYRIGVRALSSSKRLKNRFQELGIPPWLRDYYPLLYKDDALLAIGANWLPGQPPLFTIDIEWRAIEQT